jgi:hypothetical protein
MCIVAVVVVMALVVWGGLYALESPSRTPWRPQGSARNGDCPMGKSGRIHVCPRGSSPVQRE